MSAAPEMSERSFQDRIVETAHLFGWQVIHFGTAGTGRGWRTPARYDGAGAPDLILVHPSRQRVLHREVKARRGQLTDEQKRWGEWLTAAGADYAVWRPKDWDAILDELRG